MAAILLVVGLAALAVWQVHRRAQKLDLIARVEARIHAAPTSAPGPEHWAEVSAATDEYRRVVVTGRWIEDRSALVQAVTELGGGYWVMTPLARDDGTKIFVNRGFIPATERDSAAWQVRNAGSVTIMGLLRLSESGGGFLRANAPASDRWYSRDVTAIAAARGLGKVAPYFIDTERTTTSQGSLPVAGLTVIAFSNNHLVYALTWAALALMTAASTIFVTLDVLRPRWFGWRQAGLNES
ncbi:SURF1 family protein [Microvirga sp. Mcv34]|uniref:SURF1 family protein n=1 Tax=Microvirga sp. Mcv34 TaxID=2926016 RepID=UPI0021C71CC9|nr:SURF1 family protein [Microvirga sp. Mcv34]